MGVIDLNRQNLKYDAGVFLKNIFSYKKLNFCSLQLKIRICIKNTFFKEKLFTTEVQGIFKGAWLVRRL
jgi:hypothetical protein